MTLSTAASLSPSAKASAFPMSDDLLSYSDITQHFGPRCVLNGLSLHVQSGECFGLLGPNGSGKSTALALLAGVLKPSAGTIRYAGELLPAARRTLFREAGFVFQSPALDPKLSVLQNLRLAARLRGFSRAEAAQCIDEQLALAELTDRADDTVLVLSGGLRRRLDLARALLHRPRLLVLDEPTAGLDELSFRQFWQRLASLRRKLGLTIMVATHRPDEAEHCDRLAIMAEGKLALVNTPEALRRGSQRDAVVVQPSAPQQLQALCEELHSKFGLPCTLEQNRLTIECQRGHELIPRLVEAYPEGYWATVSLRHPTLADVFFKVTGQPLGADDLALEVRG